MWSVIIRGRNTVEAEDHYMLANPEIRMCYVRHEVEEQ